MTLEAAFDRIHEKLTRFAAGARMAEDAVRLNRQHDYIKDRLNTVEKCAAGIDVLKKEGVTISALPSLKRAVSVLREITEEGKKSDASGGYPREKWVVVQEVEDPLERSLLSSWSNFLSQAKTSEESSLLNTLQKLKAISRADVDELKRISAELDRIPHGIPTNRSVVKKVGSLKDRKMKIMSQLDKGHIPEDVYGFIKKLSQNRATLNDVTPDIEAWLDEKDLKSSLRILP